MELEISIPKWALIVYPIVTFLTIRKVIKEYWR
jgi:hypothetical protein